MKKYSILCVTVSRVRAGVEEHILTLLRGIDRDVFRMHLAAPTDLLDALGADIPSHVDVFPCDPDRRGWIREGVRLARYIRGRRFDVVHSHMFRGSAFASPVAWMCRVPLVIETAHGREAWRRGWLKRSYIVDRFVNRFVDLTIAVSEANAEYLRNEKKIDRRKIVVIRNGCDIRRFHPDHRAPEQLKHDLLISDTDPVALVVGRLEPQKGHATLLRALPEALAACPQLRIVCLGDGSLREELQDLARDLNVMKNVSFVGFHPNVADWLALSDFTVLPSLYEGLPLAAIESLAAGRSMVATAVEGTSEVIVHEQTGLLAPPNDPGALSRAMCRLARDVELRRKLATAGRERVAEEFSQDLQLSKTEALYRRATGPGGARKVDRATVGNAVRFVG